jgi:peroxiredoxin
MFSLDQLKFNDPAPDVAIFRANGQPVRLSEFWERQVLVLAFTRHFGCPQCKEMVEQLVHFLPELAKRGIGLALVTHAAPEKAAVFCAQRAPGVDCLADPTRAAYRAYGLGHASLWQTFLSLHVWRSNRRLRIEKGWKPEFAPAGQDSMQMSGVFVIGQDGRIRLPYYYEDIADHPPVELLMGGVMGVDWNRPLNGPISLGGNE